MPNTVCYGNGCHAGGHMNVLRYSVFNPFPIQVFYDFGTIVTDCICWLNSANEYRFYVICFLWSCFGFIGSQTHRVYGNSDVAEISNCQVAFVFCLHSLLVFMSIGYQRELTYRHADGSYSAFGSSDKEGSSWLTAFVIKSFAQAKPFIHIDQNDLDKSIRWLTSTQLENGCFPQASFIFLTSRHFIKFHSFMHLTNYCICLYYTDQIIGYCLYFNIIINYVILNIQCCFWNNMQYSILKL